MKIAYCFNNYLKNSENWAYRQINSLSNEEIYISSFEYEHNNFYNPKFKYITSPFYKIKWSRSDNRPFVVTLINRLIELASPLYIKYVTKVFKKEKIEIMHSHFATAGWRYQPIATKLGIPHVISFYGWEYEKLPSTSPYWKKRYKKLFEQADLMVTTEASELEKLVELGCPKEKIFIGRLGVDYSLIPEVLPRSKKSDSLRLVQIARCEEKKGFIYSLKAFHKALKNCPNMVLDLYGIDSRHYIGRELIEYVKENSLEKYVKINGAIEYKRLYEVIGEYDVFIHPSCYAKDLDCEGGAPIVLIDAQVIGVPVISTYHCDTPDSLEEGKSGFLAEEKSVEGLVPFIEKFYCMDNEEFQFYSENAKKFVHREYNAERNAQKLFNLYQKLVD